MTTEAIEAMKGSKRKQRGDSNFLTSISWPIHAKETRRKTAQTTAKAIQNGETAKVRCETAPKMGNFTNDCAEFSNHLKLQFFEVSLVILVKISLSTFQHDKKKQTAEKDASVKVISIPWKVDIHRTLFQLFYIHSGKEIRLKKEPFTTTWYWS